jgi:hypothetical protein
MDVGVGHARPYDVDPDPLGRDLPGEPDAERVDGALRCRVVDVLARSTDPGGSRGDEDDRAAVAPVQGGEPAHGLAAADDCADHVDGQDPLDPLNAQRGERAHRVGCGKCGEHVRLHRVVRPDRPGHAAGRFDPRHDRGGRCLVDAVGETDGPARSSGRPRHGGADPATPTRDERNPTIHRLTVTNTPVEDVG